MSPSFLAAAPSEEYFTVIHLTTGGSDASDAEELAKLKELRKRYGLRNRSSQFAVVDPDENKVLFSLNYAARPDKLMPKLKKALEKYVEEKSQ